MLKNHDYLVFIADRKIKFNFEAPFTYTLTRPQVQIVGQRKKNIRRYTTMESDEKLWIHLKVRVS